MAVDPSLYCGYCRRCRSGRGNLCENWAAIGDTVDGAFAEYVAVPAANAHLLPDGIDGQLGAMIEPLACAVHGLRRLGGVFGDSVVLTGAGTMGLLLLQLLVHAGAGPVTVVDRVPDRLEVARKLGAARVATSLDDLTDERFEVAVDATGVPAVIEAVAGLLDRGGRLLVFGVAPAEAPISLSPSASTTTRSPLPGRWRSCAASPRRSSWSDRGDRPAPAAVRPLSLDEFGEALRRVRAGQGIKWHISPSAFDPPPGLEGRFPGIVDRCVHRDVHNDPLSSMSTRAEALRVIVVAGEVLVDLVVGPDGGVDPRLGGGPYNAARSLARLGAGDHVLRRAGRRPVWAPAARRA